MEALRKALKNNAVMSSGYNNRGTIGSSYGSSYEAPPVSLNKNI